MSTAGTSSRQRGHDRGRGTAPRHHDVAVLGGGPTAILVALLAAERGLSVRLLAGPWSGARADERSNPPGSGLIGFDHPHGFPWLVRRAGSDAARRFVALIRSGTTTVSRLRKAHRIDIAIEGVPSFLVAAPGAGNVTSTLAALEVAGVPVVACEGRQRPAAPRVVGSVAGEQRVDEDALLRGCLDAFQHLSGTLDRAAYGEPVRDRDGWQLQAPGHRVEAATVVLADEQSRGRRVAGRRRPAQPRRETCLLEVADPRPATVVRSLDRAPNTLVFQGHAPDGHGRVWVSGAVPPRQATLPRWPDLDLREAVEVGRWQHVGRMRGGLPAYGAGRLPGLWRLDGLAAWGLAVQAAAAHEVVNGLIEGRAEWSWRSATGGHVGTRRPAARAS